MSISRGSSYGRSVDLIGPDLGLWLYVVLGLAVLVDCVLPLIPSEAAVLTAAAMAADGETSMAGVVIATAVGAVCGDLVVFGIGRWLQPSRLGRWMSRGRWSQAFTWRGPRSAGVVIAGRFLPMGRTAVALGCGAGRVPLARFVPASVVGASLWAGFIVALARIGGSVSDRLPVVVAIGLAVGLLITFAVARIALRVPVGAQGGIDSAGRGAASALDELVVGPDPAAAVKVDHLDAA